MNITGYESLLAAARQQTEPQQLLLVFLQASLPDDSTDDEKNSFNSGQGCALEPVMFVNKPPE